MVASLHWSTQFLAALVSSQTMLVPAQDVPPQDDWVRVDGPRALATLEEIPTKRAGYRTPEDVAGLRRAEEMVADRLIALGYEPQFQDVERPPRIALTTPPDAPTPRNIWVDLPGEGDHALEWLVVMAHLDAVVGSPGADDNGTGVVALLELAANLRERPRERSLRLLFTTLEEVGLQGARAHCVEWLEPKVEAGQMRIYGGISLDLLGYYSDEPGSQRSPLPPIDGVEQPDRGDFLALVGIRRHQAFTQDFSRFMREAEPDAPVVVIDMFVVPPPDILRSDHAEFLIRGWPGAMLTDTANFRNPHYHKPTDTVETIDRERFVRAIGQIVGATDAMLNPSRAKRVPAPSESDDTAGH